MTDPITGALEGHRKILEDLEEIGAEPLELPFGTAHIWEEGQKFCAWYFSKSDPTKARSYVKANSREGLLAGLNKLTIAIEQAIALLQTPRQHLVWLPEKKTSLTLDIPEGISPRHVWSLPIERDPDNPPELPIRPVHRGNAWYQDQGHDWRLACPGKLRYSSVETNGEHWILLEESDE